MNKRTISRLSPGGQQRRRDMLKQLQSELDSVNRRRRLKQQTIAGGALVLFLLAGSLWSAGVFNRPGSDSVVNESSEELTPQPESKSNSMVVYNRPGLVRQLVVRNRDVRSSPLKITRLNNEDLELLLAEHGHPFSVASIDDRLVAVSNTVAPE